LATGENPERAIERLEHAQDDLEVIITEAYERDGIDYFKWMKVRVRLAVGEYYLSLSWYGESPPSASVVYAPDGFWMTNWFKTLNRDGQPIWEACLEERK